ncbi:hypothetical protein BV22DRAFT_328877 [Leucogyrophana mollusca]|uniref:Uncharacterized protein n=1 Tax=Leucogyrophana mollusca TaxID=85980 RepID=A0ACB8BNJ1_9AGAM|nr:hypothetical protein BV22DRAFT_328877 [Leucogyrophana mollusca]
MPSAGSGEMVFVQGTSTPSSSEFMAHPDYRQIAAFFLGWVFLYSVYSIVSLVAGQSFRLHLPSSKVRTKDHTGSGSRWTAVEKLDKTRLPTVNVSGLIAANDGSQILVATLSFCFAFASTARFASLLTFNASSGPGACAFVVTWGGISGACARLIGLIILTLELRRLGIKQWETYLFCGWLFVGIALVFATYAISTGAIEFVPQLGVYFCYRVRYLPTSLTTSIWFLLVELCLVVRLFLLIAPSFLEFRHRVGALVDTRILRALSLLLLELLTVVPDAMFISIVGDFVPFSIGALAVLVTFNKPVATIVTGDTISIPPTSIPGSAIPTARSSRFPRLSIQTHIPNHPFAARALSSSTMQADAGTSWSPAGSDGNSTHSLDTSTAQSIKAAVVQVASRTKYTQLAPRMLGPTVSTVPTLSEDSFADLRNLYRYDSEAMPSIPQPVSEAHKEPRHILLNQDEYAKQFLQEGSPKRTGLPIRPRITVPTFSSHVSARSPSPQPHSADSVRYGSDIVRAKSLSQVDMTKRNLRRSCASAMPSTTSFGSLVDTSTSTPTTFRPHSWATVVVPVASPTEPPPLPTPRHGRRLTFGQRTPSSRSVTFAGSTEGALAQSPGRVFRRLTSGEQSSRSLGRAASRKYVRPLPILIGHSVVADNSNDDSPTDLGMRTRQELGKRIRGPRPPPKAWSPIEEISTGGKVVYESPHEMLATGSGILYDGEES